MSEVKQKPSSGEPHNLMDGIFQEMNRVRELAMLRMEIQNAEQAIKENDIIKMLVAYENLKGCQ